ncbi:MAG: shikimate kinase [Nitrospirota bacterium]
MRNITLVGFMGTGKTTVGRILAKKLGYRFIDVDEEIEREQGVSITHIFSKMGEPYFRQLERGLIKTLSLREGLIISAGGGAVVDENNVEAMKQGGALVCLTARPDEIMKRVGNSSNRPLLQVPDPMAKIMELMGKREPFYSKADFMVDTTTMTPEEVAGEVIRLTAGIL